VGDINTQTGRNPPLGYTIKRGLKQNPVLLASDGRAINTVDLDRGTFLPLDAYSSLEIEAIASGTVS
jgi:hypothetical protein